MMKKIEQELVNRIASILSADPAGVDVNAPLHTLGLDSMRMVEIIVFIEKQYGIDLMGSGLKPDDVSSVAALARTVERGQTL